MGLICLSSHMWSMLAKNFLMSHFKIKQVLVLFLLTLYPNSPNLFMALCDYSPDSPFIKRCWVNPDQSSKESSSGRLLNLESWSMKLESRVSCLMLHVTCFREWRSILRFCWKAILASARICSDLDVGRLSEILIIAESTFGGGENWKF